MPPRHSADRRPATLALMVGLLCLPGTVAVAEDFGAARFLRPPQEQAAPAALMSAGLTDFEPAGLSSRVRRTLLQYEALTADGAWDEAIALIERLQSEAGDELTAAPDAMAPVEDAKDHDRYLPIATRCQELLAALPLEGLEAYRSRVDRSARERLDEAAARLDAVRLERLVRELYASTPTADALLALGELALERGDYAAARRWHARLHPLLWDPYGRPAAASLVLIDPATDPSRLATAWTEGKRPDGLPLAPTADDLLPTALSRLALTSIREGDLRRAAAETRLLKALAPEAEGRIAGRIQSLAPALEAMLEQRRSESESVSRLGELVWAWPDAVTLEKQEPQREINPRGRGLRLNAFGQIVAIAEPAPHEEETAPPTLRAVVDGLSAFYVENDDVVRLDLETGETRRQLIPGAAGSEPEGPRPAIGDVAQLFAHRVVVNGVPVQRGAPLRRVGAAGPTRIDPNLAVHDGVLYARVVESQWPNRVPAGRVTMATKESLVGVKLDAAAEPSVRFLPPTDGLDAAGQETVGFQFVTAPTVRGDRLFVAVARPGARSDIAVACYAAPTGRLLWLTDLGSGDPALRAAGASPAPLVASGDSLYVMTNLGAVASLDASSGRLRWLARYPRSGQPVIHIDQPPQPASPCVLVGDQLIAAPEDSRRLLAWDAATGAPLWDADRPSDANLVGVMKSPEGAVVVLAGRQLASYDTLTGQRRLLWPESPRAGVRGLGAAAIQGGEVFWPTRDAVIAIDPTTGARTRSPIDLAPVGGAGANLIATDFGLLVGGSERFRLLTDVRAAAPSEPAAPVSRLKEAGQNELAANPR